ncbi:hypothetical protein F9C07_1527912 [Aspergillus flavus]|uniref:Uncharacterized protein n=1 Tax=Aspergillus flavus (strain ATCC 200026 / FGSC A1120 / IAM 13836 / NRRL 3357 / JCM 12722 / SRRC 167) TaxID=332952 RepID=A0A7U2MUC6_ASPFN|nr:hypothetical protein F9C07_1527912 [Aspergillus flavus]
MPSVYQPSHSLRGREFESHRCRFFLIFISSLPNLITFYLPYFRTHSKLCLLTVLNIQSTVCSLVCASWNFQCIARKSTNC